MNKIRLLLLSLGASSAVILLAVAVAGPSQANAAASCSIARIDAEVPLQLSSAGPSAIGGAVDAFAGEYPNAVILDRTSVKIHAPTVPAIDGQTATAITFTDDMAQAAGGPVEQAGSRLVRVACGVAFYDPATGAFIGDLKIMADVPLASN